MTTLKESGGEGGCSMEREIWGREAARREGVQKVKEGGQGTARLPPKEEEEANEGGGGGRAQQGYHQVMMVVCYQGRVQASDAILVPVSGLLPVCEYGNWPKPHKSCSVLQQTGQMRDQTLTSYAFK